MNIIKNIKQCTCGRDMACAIACETIHFLILALLGLEDQLHAVEDSNIFWISSLQRDK